MYGSVHCIGDGTPGVAASLQLLTGEPHHDIDLKVVAELPQPDAGLEARLAGGIKPCGFRIEVCRRAGAGVSIGFISLLQ
jgi:hypothetical protein